MQRKHSKNKRSILTVYVSLFLSLILFCSATFTWFVARDTATIQSDELEMNASAGLRVNEGEEITNKIVLDGVLLGEASSVDGRNIFFPLSGNYTDTTSDMKFREGTIGDQNDLYIYKNFTMHGDSDQTEIYVKSYSVVVTDVNKNEYVYDGGTKIYYNNNIPDTQDIKKECPIRIAFIEDSVDSPTLIDPTALVDEHATNYNAVKSTTSDGTPTLETTNATAFSNHYFGNNQPLVILTGTQSKSVTMVAWFEATASSTVCDMFAGATVNIEIELESNFSDMELIYFIDNTIGDGDTEDDTPRKWINSEDSIMTMSYVDESDDTTRTVVMRQLSDDKWCAYLPKSVETNIYFYRYDLIDNIIYNAWYTTPQINSSTTQTVKDWLDHSNYDAYNHLLQTTRGEGTTYTARRGNGNGEVEGEDDNAETQRLRLAPSIGFWDSVTTDVETTTSPDSGGGDDNGSTENTLITVHFTADLSSSIASKLKNNGYKLYVELKDPSGTLTPYELYASSDTYDHCRREGIQVLTNTTIVRLYIKQSNTIKELKTDGTILTSNNNYWYYNYNLKDLTIS